MVDRIDKIEKAEYWQVAASAETQKDREQMEGREKDTFASLSEKTDWRLLFDKSQLWKRNIQVLREEIKQVIYRKINLKTDPSLLRVDIELNGGELISPAFLAIARHVGLKIKNLRSGDKIPEELIFINNVLRITVPQNPKLFIHEEERQEKRLHMEDPAREKTLISRHSKEKSFLKKINISLTPEMFLIYGLLLITLLCLVGGYLLLR